MQRRKRTQTVWLEAWHTLLKNGWSWNESIRETNWGTCHAVNNREDSFFMYYCRRRCCCITTCTSTVSLLSPEDVWILTYARRGRVHRPPNSHGKHLSLPFYSNHSSRFWPHSTVPNFTVASELKLRVPEGALNSELCPRGSEKCQCQPAKYHSSRSHRCEDKNK